MIKRRVRLSKQEIKRQTKRKELIRISLGDLDGTPADVSRYLLSVADSYNKYDELLYEHTTEYYEGNERNEYLVLVGYNLETDKEYDTRIEKLKETKRKEIERVEKVERATMKKLLKKYGK